MSQKPCSTKSKFKDNEMYECGQNGRFVLKKGYKRQNTEGAPKRPLTAYFLWVRDNREQFKQNNPGKKVTELAQLMGTEWRSLDDKKKQQWADEAAKLKEQYGKQAEKFKKTGELTEIVQKEKTKRTPSAYILWSKDARPGIKKANPDMSFGDISKVLGGTWKSLSDSKKQPYVNQANKLKKSGQ